MNTLQFNCSHFELVLLKLHNNYIRQQKKEEIIQRREEARSGRFSHTLSEILTDVCNVFNIPVKKIKSADRSEDFNRCRQIFYYVARLKTKYPFRHMANLINRSNHSTAWHGYNTVKDWLDVDDPSFIPYWKYYIHNSSLYLPEDFV